MAAGCKVGVMEILVVRRPAVGSIAWLDLFLLRVCSAVVERYIVFSHSSCVANRRAGLAARSAFIAGQACPSAPERVLLPLNDNGVPNTVPLEYFIV